MLGTSMCKRFDWVKFNLYNSILSGMLSYTFLFYICGIMLALLRMRCFPCRRPHILLLVSWKLLVLQQGWRQRVLPFIARFSIFFKYIKHNLVIVYFSVVKILDWNGGHDRKICGQNFLHQHHIALPLVFKNSCLLVIVNLII